MINNNFKNTFPNKKSLIGMIHLLPLPGTPKYRGSLNEIYDQALIEAELYTKNGVDALMIENMHDVPYLNKCNGPEILACMSVVSSKIKNLSKIPCGVQILAADNLKALCCAKSSNLDFIRAEGFVFAHIGDEGLIDSDAGTLLRYRKMIDADDVMIFTDIKKKHSSHSITKDTSLVETAKAAEYFLSDGLIITGTSTGEPVKKEELEQIQSVANGPILIGSGIDIENIAEYINLADAFIVGSHFKKDGKWNNNIDEERVKKFVEVFQNKIK